ncbi:MAG: mechanosensitive ion channel family protein [Mediterranea sp.]|jgi:miniconductance mechanosensitive channel|nr:mechanosensitive ion channel family protein [Mediterranea sp.]
MNLVNIINKGLTLLGLHGETAEVLDQIIAFALLLLVAYLADFICRKILLNVVGHLVKKTKAKWDDVLFDRKVIVHLSRMAAPIVIYALLPFVLVEADVAAYDVVRRICLALIIIMAANFFNTQLTAAYNAYHNREQFRDRPLKGMLQTLQIIIYAVATLGIISVVLSVKLSGIFTAMGASAAILMLIFKDSIMGFVAGVQLSTNKMLQVGDWIVMPKYNADGNVIEVSLNTVKVQNWDNTIVTIPPYSLMSDSFQNWRGMQESGGRRVKRSVNIDMNSVHFCTPAMLEKYRKIHLLSDYIEQKEQDLHSYNQQHNIDGSVPVNGRHQTNLGIFRAYLTNYLENHPNVNHELTCMVRQLQPTEKGIPIELYFFSAIKEWVAYENLQSDVFDHVVAIIPEFDLQVYQAPSGADFRTLKN